MRTERCAHGSGETRDRATGGFGAAGRRFLAWGALLAVTFAGARPAGAQCLLDWSSRFGTPTANCTPYAFSVFDDGTGPGLYVGGCFTSIGGIDANRVARWDGRVWSPLGTGVVGHNPAYGTVRALTVFDDGQGAALYVGGEFETAGGTPAPNLAKWDGLSWSDVGGGLNGTVQALAVFDDGSGPALYVGGAFTTAGGVSANAVAKWDGQQWSAVGGGLSSPPYTSASVSALTVFSHGAGPALYVGGYFTAAGGTSANHIARWDGASWSALGSGMGGNNPVVWALTVFDDGGGTALYAGGRFHTAGGLDANYVAKWDGSQWATLGTGMAGGPSDPYVRALTAYDDGTGLALYAGGDFTSAGGTAASRVARWDGAQWAALGGGVGGAQYSNPVYALGAFDDGGGSALYVGGGFTSAGGFPVQNLARWNGQIWSGWGAGMSGDVYALAACDGAPGPGLYAGGIFERAGHVPMSHIARWDGSTWHPLGGGVSGDQYNSGVYALTLFDHGTGPAVYAGGNFTTAGNTSASNIAKWDGVTWSRLGSGIEGSNARVAALAVFDDGSGPSLYAGGYFTLAGGVSARSIAKWDGSSWSPLGDGLGTPYGPGTVYALAVFDDGSAPALYVGGYFRSAGGAPANYIAKWNGTAWASVGNGVQGDYPVVYSLVVFDDGDGAALYVGGHFRTAGGVTVNNIARWDGTTWSGLGAGLGPSADVNTLTVLDDGRGPALHAGGRFNNAGGNPVANIARWHGGAWWPLSGGISDRAYAMSVFDDDGPGPRPATLYLGGKFSTASGRPSYHIAEWGCLRDPLPGDLDCDGYVDFWDVDPFVLALTDPAAYAALYPHCSALLADINDDGIVNFDDIDLFVALLGR